MERHDVDQVRLPLEGREHIEREARRCIAFTRDPFADVASDVEQVGAVGQLPQAIADETAVGVRGPRAGAPRPVDAQEGLQGGLGRVEPDLGLAVVLQAGKGVEQQQRLVRGPPAAPGELTDAIEPGEQGLAVERYRGRCPIEA